MIRSMSSFRRMFGRSGRCIFLSSFTSLAQLFGNLEAVAGEALLLPKPPLGSFPQAHPGSLPAARSSMFLGGGNGGGGRSCLILGIAIGPEDRDANGIPEDRPEERLRRWLPL